MKSLAPFTTLVLIPILVTAPLSAQQPPPAPTPEASVVNALQLRLVGDEDNLAPTGSLAKGLVIAVTDGNGVPVPDAAIAFRLPDDGATGTFADGTHAAIAYTDQTGRARINDIHWGSTPGVVEMRVTVSKGVAHAGILLEETLTSSSSQPTRAQALSNDAVPARIPTPPPAVPAGTSSSSAPAQPTITVQSAAAPEMTSPNHLTSSSSDEPRITIASDPAQKKHGGKGKWILLALVAAGAGAGVAMAGHGKSKSSGSSAPGLSVGQPSISVGSGH